MLKFRTEFFRTALLIACVVGLSLVGSNAAATDPEPQNIQSDPLDPFRPLRPFIGKWEGDSKGQPGIGKMEREYSFVLKDRFIQTSNKAVYAPQEKNPKGEVHEDLGFFGYDKAQKKLSFRQFHVEGFVVQYTLESMSEDSRTLVFKSTVIENISPGWVARETYRFLNNDEFIETFALAGPGKDFETYSETQFRRKK
jgi:hypothetical protein